MPSRLRASKHQQYPSRCAAFRRFCKGAQQNDPILMSGRHLSDGRIAPGMVSAFMEKRMKQAEEDVAALTVRVPRALVSDIDRDRKARAVRVPRNTWILEAVVEKLDRKKQGQRNGSGHGAGDGQE